MKQINLLIILAFLSILVMAREPTGMNNLATIRDSPEVSFPSPAVQIPDTNLVSQPYIVQEPDTSFHRNAVYLELLGQGIFYSVNYDYRFSKNFSLRAGFTYWTLNNDFIFFQLHELRYMSFPIMVNYLIGDYSNHLEIGIGLMPAFLSGNISVLYQTSTNEGQHAALIGTATLGYRYQPREGGFIFRAGLTPIFNTNGFSLYAGLSAGIGF